MTYVYFIQHGYGSIKIGVSDNPEERCKQLQTGNQKKLRVICKFPFERRRTALDLERELHEKFKEHRLEGEWFRKSILRKFKNRAVLFPNVFNGGMVNDYDKARD